MTYKPPTYTQVPNLLLDKHVQKMSKAELKIILATCRKTFGWQKGKDRISYTQFEKLTGLSRASVQEGIKQAVANGYLRRYKVRNGFEYALAIDSIPEIGTVSEKTIPEIEHTKESILKKTTVSDPITDSLKQKQDSLEGYPGWDIDYLLPFVAGFKRSPTVGQKSGWIKAVKEWIQMGVRPEDVCPMYQHTKQQGLTIKSPFSITFAYDALRNKVDEYAHVRKGA